MHDQEAVQLSFKNSDDTDNCFANAFNNRSHEGVQMKKTLVLGLIVATACFAQLNTAAASVDSTMVVFGHCDDPKQDDPKQGPGQDDPKQDPKQDDPKQDPGQDPGQDPHQRFQDPCRR